MTSVGCGQKTHSVIIPPWDHFVDGGLCNYVPEWEKATKNSISLQNLLQLKTIQVGPTEGHKGVTEQCLFGTESTGRIDLFGGSGTT